MAPPPSDGILKPDDETYNKPDSEFRLLEKNDSWQKEKQISIDPISLRELLPVVVSAPKVKGLMELPPSLLPGKPKFLSCSLPNSANSSPRFSSSFLKKKFKNESHCQASPLQHENGDESEQPNNAEDHHKQPTTLPLEFYLRRSKSCGEGRSFAPSDDFDLWLDKPDFSAQLDGTKHFPSFSRADQMMSNKKVNNHRKKSGDNHVNLSSSSSSSSDDSFKCGALCLFLPGFGKAKAVRPLMKVEEEREGEEEFEMKNVISRTVSLEKFECGSWASSAIGDFDSMNNYFDLPMELIRSGANDAHSPVTAGFLFDKDLKGVLKNGSSRSRKSHESARHVRFSTASPMSQPASPATCITPRLRKAREDFNAFLEAQSA